MGGTSQGEREMRWVRRSKVSRWVWQRTIITFSFSFFLTVTFSSTSTTIIVTLLIRKVFLADFGRPYHRCKYCGCGALRQEGMTLRL